MRPAAVAGPGPRRFTVTHSHHHLSLNCLCSLVLTSAPGIGTYGPESYAVGGRGFNGTLGYWQRLPASAQKDVDRSVWSYSLDSCVSPPPRPPLPCAFPPPPPALLLATAPPPHAADPPALCDACRHARTRSACCYTTTTVHCPPNCPQWWYRYFLRRLPHCQHLARCLYTAAATTACPPDCPPRWCFLRRLLHCQHVACPTAGTSPLPRHMTVTSPRHFATSYGCVGRACSSSSPPTPPRLASPTPCKYGLSYHP